MIIKKLKFASHSQPRQTVLFDLIQNGTTINSGTVLLKKGTRIPEKGFSQHEQLEISYILSGQIQTYNIDGAEGTTIGAGEVVQFDPLEPQAGFALEETKIIYVLVGSKI